MLILYLVVFFFIIIFNVLFPLIIEKNAIQEQILTSTNGKKATKIRCSNNYWFFIEPKITGLELKYFVNEKNEPMTCKTDMTKLNKTRTCGLNGEYNNRYHPCYSLLSELLFYRAF